MIENAKILTVELKWFERGVKEAIYIRVAKPSLNKDGGQYNLPPVWNNILTSRVRGPGPKGTGDNQSRAVTSTPSTG